MPPFSLLLILIGISWALTWELTEKVLHVLHALAAFALAAVTANVEMTNRNDEANRCLGRYFPAAPPPGRCPSPQFGPQFPHPSFVELSKEVMVLLLGAAIGWVIRLAWTKVNPSHIFDD